MDTDCVIIIHLSVDFRGVPCTQSGWLQMKGRIVSLTEMADDSNNKWYQVSINFDEIPNFRLGDCTILVKQ